MIKGQDFGKRGKCKHGHCSSMSNSACCDLNRNGTLLWLLDMCSNSKCFCRKQTTFTPTHFELEVSAFKTKLKKTFERTKNRETNF